MLTVSVPIWVNAYILRYSHKPFDPGQVTASLRGSVYVIRILRAATPPNRVWVALNEQVDLNAFCKLYKESRITE